MPGIENADVMMDTETKPGFGREQVKTASVVVKASGGEPIKESQVEFDPLSGSGDGRRIEAGVRHRDRSCRPRLPRQP